MKHKYAINELYLYQLVGKYWVLINDETGNVILEGNDFVRKEDFNESEFTIYEDEFNANEAESAYDVRSFVEESAQTYLVDRDNGGTF